MSTRWSIRRSPGAPDSRATDSAVRLELAQTRQADRDKALSEADAGHREALANAAGQRQEIALEHTRRLEELLAANMALTEEVQQLTRQIHQRLVPGDRG